MANNLLFKSFGGLWSLVVLTHCYLRARFARGSYGTCSQVADFVQEYTVASIAIHGSVASLLGANWGLRQHGQCLLLRERARRVFMGLNQIEQAALSLNSWRHNVLLNWECRIVSWRLVRGSTIVPKSVAVLLSDNLRASFAIGTAFDLFRLSGELLSNCLRCVHLSHLAGVFILVLLDQHLLFLLLERESRIRMFLLLDLASLLLLLPLSHLSLLCSSYGLDLKYLFALTVCSEKSLLVIGGAATLVRRHKHHLVRRLVIAVRVFLCPRIESGWVCRVVEQLLRP